MTFVFRFIRPLPLATPHHTLTIRLRAVDHVSYSRLHELCEGCRFSERHELRIYPATNIY